jgi:hypothetical protein
MRNQTKSRPVIGWLLILLQFLLGLGALAGGAVLIAAPDGGIIHMPLSMLKDSPFQNFLIPGLILFTLLGVFPVLVAFSLWRRPVWRWPDAVNPFKQLHWSWAASLAAGVMLVIWITVEVLIVRSIAFLHILYFIWGWVLILVTLLPAVREFYWRKKAGIVGPRVLF